MQVKEETHIKREGECEVREIEREKDILGQLLPLSLDHFQGAALEVEQPGHERNPYWMPVLQAVVSSAIF